MTERLFTIPLCGTDCAVRGHKALHVAVYTWGRVVVHDRGWYCHLPEPGADEPHAPVEHWRTAQRRVDQDRDIDAQRAHQDRLADEAEEMTA